MASLKSITMFLTLVVVPVIYCYLDDLANWARRKFSPRHDVVQGVDGLAK